MPENYDPLETALKKDGTLDADKVAEILAKQKKELDRVVHESVSRKEKIRVNADVLADKEKEIAEREVKIKAIDEAKLKEDEKFQEIIALKEKEIEKLKGVEVKVKELEAYKGKIAAQQSERIEGKIAELSEVNRGIYDAAASGMADDAFSSKLTLLEKLGTVTPPPADKSQAGGRGASADYDSKTIKDEELMALKEKNPALFQSLIKEQVLNTA